MEEELRYPIGHYAPMAFSYHQKELWLLELAGLPQDVEMAIENLDEGQLQTPYREGGWTVHQLIHHLADSHMHAYIRFKSGLTENNPTIKTYDEKKWALLNDVKTLPVNISITLLYALHSRWVAAMKDLTEEQWDRTIFHPELKKDLSLWYLFGLYVWHGHHHVQHIISLRKRNNW